ncbi:MAG: terminase [Burkholderiaceae bacterium]|nr:terminase [Burkholderiaceae bacterium]
MARPTKFKPEFVEQAKKLCALGATAHDLASFFGVAVSTVKLWQVEHKAFSDALKVGKAVADRMVEQSLFRRALGYEHDETDIRVVGTRLVKTPMRKHYPPDTTACIFWLKNRRPDLWRDKTELGGTIEHRHSLADVLGSLGTSTGDRPPVA